MVYKRKLIILSKKNNIKLSYVYFKEKGFSSEVGAYTFNTSSAKSLDLAEHKRINSSQIRETLWSGLHK
jgi:hypothetical protein